jgi:hypothetical protein
MKIIAHRGNLYGPNPDKENRPHYIMEALNKGFDCEIDVRYINNKWFLGHDTPDYEIIIDFLLENSDKLWIHCKNIGALHKLLEYPQLNIFWHQEDDFTLTSKGYIWTFPGKEITERSIAVMPEWTKKEIPENAFGVCSDFFDYKPMSN